MPAAQIQPTKTPSVDSSSLEEEGEKKDVSLSNEKMQGLAESAVVLPWTRKLPALILILMFVCKHTSLSAS